MSSEWEESGGEGEGEDKPPECLPPPTQLAGDVDASHPMIDKPTEWEMPQSTPEVLTAEPAALDREESTDFGRPEPPPLEPEEPSEEETSDRGAGEGGQSRDSTQLQEPKSSGFEIYTTYLSTPILLCPPLTPAPHIPTHTPPPPSTPTDTHPHTHTHPHTSPPDQILWPL